MSEPALVYGGRPRAFPSAHGFWWYPEDSEACINVSRIATLYGKAVVGVTVTAHGCEVGDLPRLQIAVSPKGRAVRVWRSIKGGPWVELGEIEGSTDG